ncbi:MAG: hypothetical protein Q7K29_04765, partial [Thermoleophilia bacterium]|nr:hypothetical protein [Thermoleophilia bacterium]
VDDEPVSLDVGWFCDVSFHNQFKSGAHQARRRILEQKKAAVKYLKLSCGRVAGGSTEAAAMKPLCYSR